MIKTYKTISLLLSYPTNELKEFLAEIIPEIEKEDMLEEDQMERISQFISNYSNIPLLEWQEQYVQLFDFTSSVSLHLFEHVHGNSTERGQAMVNLMEEYTKTGVYLKPGELPDYLPVFLEYLSLLDTNQAAKMLTETVDILGTIYYHLKESDNSYANLFSALISLAEKPPKDLFVERKIRTQKPYNLDMEYDTPKEKSCKKCN